MTVKPAATATPRRGPEPLVVESVGQPARLSMLSRMLLEMHLGAPLAAEPRPFVRDDDTWDGWWIAPNQPRHIIERLQTPPWADRRAIAALYAAARSLTAETGQPHHVDHELPLRGRLVSGLHVHNNLQVLPGVENGRKSNRFEVE